MARRGSTKTNPVAAVAGFLVLAVLIAVAFWYLGQTKEPFRTVETLDSAVYLENANSLRGNAYKINAVVLNSLAWVPDRGRLYSFEVKNGTRTDVVAVLIPAEFNAINLQKGQRFWVRLEVGEGGVLFARELVKT